MQSIRDIASGRNVKIKKKVGFLETVKQKYQEGKKLYNEMQEESTKRASLRAKKQKAILQELKVQTAVQKARNELNQARQSSFGGGFGMGDNKPYFQGSIGGGSAFMGTVGTPERKKSMKKKRSKGKEIIIRYR